jgi:hypothetical protein
MSCGLYLDRLKRSGTDRKREEAEEKVYTTVVDPAERVKKVRVLHNGESIIIIIYLFFLCSVAPNPFHFRV